MKKRAFVRYSKQGKIVPGSLILTSGSYPNGPSTWNEVPADLCCNNFGIWKVVTGGIAGDGVVLSDNPNDTNVYTIIGPNDSKANGWVYLKGYFPSGAELTIQYDWTSFDEGISVDRPVYWTSTTEPTGIPQNTIPRVATTPQSGSWGINVNPGEWLAVGIYSTDSCCGRGFLSIDFNI